MGSPDYDVIVVGAAPGGYVAAIRASQLGLRTAVAERAHLGGICLNWGCIPTKALLRSAEINHELSVARDFGIVPDGTPRIDLKALVARSRSVAGELNAGVAFLLKKNGVDVIWGQARLDAPGALVVEENKTKKRLGSGAQGCPGPRALRRPPHRRRHRRPPARTTGPGAGWAPDLDLL